MPDENKISIFLGRKYARALGRRKSAVAVVKIYQKGKGNFFINGQTAGQYFKDAQNVALAQSPLDLSGDGKEVDIKAEVAGGGTQAQAQALRLALARVLALGKQELKASLRKAGLLTVDARVKERKKPGLKRARRAPQWSKR